MPPKYPINHSYPLIPQKYPMNHSYPYPSINPIPTLGALGWCHGTTGPTRQDPAEPLRRALGTFGDPAESRWTSTHRIG
jgi:hypothetical protein